MLKSYGGPKSKRPTKRTKRHNLLFTKGIQALVSLCSGNLPLNPVVLANGASGSEAKVTAGTSRRGSNEVSSLAEDDMRFGKPKMKTQSRVLEKLNLTNAKRVANRGESLYQGLKPKLKGLGKDGYVVIHVASKQYVSGTTRDEATKLYEQRFGTDPGYVRRIGGFRYVGNINF